MTITTVATLTEASHGTVTASTTVTITPVAASLMTMTVVDALERGRGMLGLGLLDRAGGIIRMMIGLMIGGGSWAKKRLEWDRG